MARQCAARSGRVKVCVSDVRQSAEAVNIGDAARAEVADQAAALRTVTSGVDDEPLADHLLSPCNAHFRHSICSRAIFGKKLTSALLCAVFNARKDVNDTERALNDFRAGGGRGSTPPPVAPGTPRDAPSKDDDGATTRDEQDV